ncbi:PREDICTED: cyclin-dependent kinase-like 4 [Nicrophorus vespilloides]|uniref:Cyclin-dependent kinase-like 4 n=1 Tax=Nicrophorus vespilloides TaxID=110193 RepID=A0ABM1M9R0_NICVS|nr:PREDICTED: cyclin-dependent kinase-like 4 [Nicrophorus vespilloides]
MERYEQLSVVGEGSYGVVLKCRHRETDQIVAVKKFLETEEDASVRRMALREIRMLKKLRHENLVTMIEVFRHRKRFYLVFEFMDGTVLDELEKTNGGLGEDKSRERIFQVCRAISYIHSNNIIHRDVKPENVLVSSLGVVKLCDFGFARLVSSAGDPCTEYVATRWYRAPELLVGEQQYGAGVDIWAIGCLFSEMITGDPLFPGESDIDQLYLIVKTIGKPCQRHQQLMSKNSQLRGMIRSAANDANILYKNFSAWSLLSLDFLIACMKMDPQVRPASEDLLKHSYFTHDKFPQRFLPALRSKVSTEFSSNPLLRKYKTEILMATDKTDETKLRRSSQAEVPRWRLSLVEGRTKRKFSCDNAKTYTQKTGLTFLKQQQQQPPAIRVDSLERSIENLKQISLRPTSERKMTLESGYQTQYQSLQSFTEKSSSQQGSLTFKEPKKSPNIIQSIHNTSIKGTFNQVPLITPPRESFMKRLARNSDSNLNFDPLLSLGLNKPAWISKKTPPKKDDFTLPDLPGATSSPQKLKRKQNLDCSPDQPLVTPRIGSNSSEKSGKVLPMM